MRSGKRVIALLSALVATLAAACRSQRCLSVQRGSKPARRRTSHGAYIVGPQQANPRRNKPNRETKEAGDGRKTEHVA